MNITFDNVSFKYIERPILDNASFSVKDGDKIGVIGLNGAGKSTILKMIYGIEKPLSGEIIISGGTKINYLEQNPILKENTSLLDLVLDNEKDINEYEAKKVLSIFGFDDYNMYANNFSGGEKRKIALAKALLKPCDVLILDEPTNHLDNKIIAYLEKYLLKFKHTLIMVTHDRYFLERTCNKILELDDSKTYLYDGNYDKFLELKEERLAEEENKKRKIQSYLRTEKEWVNRGVEARRTKSKSRLEKFKKISQIKFKESKDFKFDSVNSYLGRKLIEIKDASKAFGDKVLFNNFNFILNRDDILGILGDNGAGKTTLFKIIMGQEKLDSGEIILGETLKIGYFSQEMNDIDNNLRVIDYIKEEANIIETLDGEISASALLEKFLFPKEMHYEKIKMLSGGEKRRLMLIRVLAKNPNILLLDEPSNDLDIYTLNILEDYLLSFNGPIIVISHDRYFLDKISNRLLIFDNGIIKESLLSFSQYLNSIENEKEIKEKEEKKPIIKNKIPAKIRNEFNKLKEDIDKKELIIKDLKEEQKNINPSSYIDLIDNQNKVDKEEKELDELLNRYLELDEYINNFENGNI